MLFSTESIWTMIHGIALGGGALMGLAAVLFSLAFLHEPTRSGEASARRSGRVALLTVVVSVVLWLTVLGGTYIVFPPYRAAPPEGVTVELTQYPRTFLLSSPETEWLHRFAMETKEHVPWIVAMLATAAAAVAMRHRTRLLGDRPIRRIVMALTATSFVLASYAALLGVFVNKVAPLE